MSSKLKIGPIAPLLSASRTFNRANFPDKKLITFLNAENSTVYEKCRIQMKKKCLKFVSGTKQYDLNFTTILLCKTKIKIYATC